MKEFSRWRKSSSANFNVAKKIHNMSSFTILALCFAVLLIIEAYGQDNQVCLTLPYQDVSDSVGPIGPEGVQGQKGEPGEVASCGCNPGDIAELRDQVRALRNLQSCAGVVYNNQCIKLAYTTGPAANFKKAEQVCSDLNATLAEITSVEMYNVVYDYIKTHWVRYTGFGNESVNEVYVWLGSSFETKTSNTNNMITLRNGTEVKLENWYPYGYPYKGSRFSTWERLYMLVRLHDHSIKRGLLNTSPDADTPVPLCATQLPN